MFMAFDVISGMHLGLKANPSPPFRHSVLHDLESFVWVLLYLAVTTPVSITLAILSHPSFTLELAVKSMSALSK